MPGLSTYETRHLQNIALFSRRTRGVYFNAIDKVFRAIGGIRAPEGEVFDIRKHPAFLKQLDRILASFGNDLKGVIVNGVQQSWSLANEKNDDWIGMAIGDRDIPDPVKERFFDKNIPAMNAFIDRKDSGIGLSDRIWSLNQQFRQELEAGIQVGITDGKSASSMATEMKQYLNDPSRLFRRVRDQNGQLKLSKAAKAYHPGQGQYRSSYRNALRLTRTETNMAYRTADHERWKRIKFIGGFEVKLSASHPVPDICDDLKGKYPKDFHFRGWHPACLCYAVPIRPTEQQFDKYLDSIMDGTDENFQFDNQVTGAPQMDSWFAANKDKVAGWKSKPYFMKDNEDMFYTKKKGVKDLTQNLLSNSDIKKLLNDYKVYNGDSSENGDIWLKNIAEWQGMDEKPIIMNKTDFDAVNGIEMYRGYDKQKYVDLFKNGDYYGGSGIFGSGSYFSSATSKIGIEKSKKIAMTYAQNDNKNILTAKIPGDFNVIKYGDLEKEMASAKLLTKEGVLIQDKELLMRYKSFAYDPGRYAALKGYDAIQVDVGGGVSQLIVINRSKLIVLQ